MNLCCFPFFAFYRTLNHFFSKVKQVRLTRASACKKKLRSCNTLDIKLYYQKKIVGFLKGAMLACSFQEFLR